jgi:hypothetical protein
MEDDYSRMDDPAAATETALSEDAPVSIPLPPPVFDQLRALGEQAQKGDATVLPMIREILDTRPEIWRHYGNLSVIAEQAWISVVAGKDPAVAESIRRTVQEMRAELAGENPPRLERMLVDEVLACWMETSILR